MYSITKKQALTSKREMLLTIPRESSEVARVAADLAEVAAGEVR